MENIDTDPIYKILCMTFVLLIPLLPAILLYKVAPKDKFFSRGNFSGFKINATGASAIYILLFVAFYAKVDAILAHIDEYGALQTKFQSTPWKVNLSLKLLDSAGEIGIDRYQKIINQDSIACFPKSPRCNLASNRIVTFYVDNDQVESNGVISGTLALSNGFGTVQFEFTPTKMDSVNRTITINSKFFKQSKKKYGRQNSDDFAIPVLNQSQGLLHAPKPKFQ